MAAVALAGDMPRLAEELVDSGEMRDGERVEGDSGIMRLGRRMAGCGREGSWDVEAERGCPGGSALTPSDALRAWDLGGSEAIEVADIVEVVVASLARLTLLSLLSAETRAGRAEAGCLGHGYGERRSEEEKLKLTEVLVLSGLLALSTSLRKSRYCEGGVKGVRRLFAALSMPALDGARRALGRGVSWWVESKVADCGVFRADGRCFLEEAAAIATAEAEEMSVVVIVTVAMRRKRSVSRVFSCLVCGGCCCCCFFHFCLCCCRRRLSRGRTARTAMEEEEWGWGWGG